MNCRQLNSFKFALLSDTHVFDTGSGAADLRLAVADVNSRTDLEFVLVSGDITEMNIGNNLILAKQILDSLIVPYYIIPGNHDTKWSGSAGANFRALWKDDKFIFDFAGYRFIGFHQGPVLRMDDGHIASDNLKWLQENLIQTGIEQPIILVMHYPLDSSIDNWYECVNKIKDYNIKAILHGHGHRNRLEYYQGIPGIMGRSTLRARAERGGYTIFEVTSDSLFASEQIINENQTAHWAKISLGEKYNIQQVVDSLLPDYSVNEKYPGIKLQWTFQTGYTMTASPLCDKENVYVGDASGTMYAFAKNSGKVLWQHPVSGAIYGTAAIANGYIVFTSADSNIYSLNTADGSLIWKYTTDNALVSVPIIKNDVIYVGASDGVFRALNLKTGELIWKNQNIGGYVESKPILYSGKVIYGAWDGKLYALDHQSGKQVWIWRGEKQSPLYAPAACWPVAAHEKVYIAAPDRSIYAIDTNNGKTVWKNDYWKFRETIGISQDGTQIFARSMTDSVVSFNSQSTQSTVLWAQDFGYGYDIAPSMPVEKDGTLYWGTKNGLIIAANAFDGKVNWKHKYKNYLINTVFPIDDHSVVFSNIDGDIVLLVFDPE